MYNLWKYLTRARVIPTVSLKMLQNIPDVETSHILWKSKLGKFLAANITTDNPRYRYYRYILSQTETTWKGRWKAPIVLFVYLSNKTPKMCGNFSSINHVSVIENFHFGKLNYLFYFEISFTFGVSSVSEWIILSVFLRSISIWWK